MRRGIGRLRAGGSLLTIPRGQTLYASLGDSITNGDGLTGNNSYAKLYTTANASRVTRYNGASGGTGIDYAIANAATTDAQLSGTLWRSSAVLSILVGTNDNATYTAAQEISLLAGFCDARRTAGWKVVVGTILPRSIAQGGGTGSAFDTYRNTVNAAIRTWVGVHCDAVMDFAGDPIMGAQATAEATTYYMDGLHPTDAGQALLLNVFKSAISGLTVANSIPAQYTAWNPSDKSADLTLSNANYTVGNNATPASFRAVRSVNYRESGRYYTEMLIVGNKDQVVGLTQFNMALTDGFPGQSSIGVGVFPNGGMIVAGMTAVNAPNAAAFVAGDRCCIHVDFDAGNVWIARNQAAPAGADPTAGTNPSYTFAPNSVLWLSASERLAAAFTTLPASSADLSYTRATGYSVF